MFADPTPLAKEVVGFVRESHSHCAPERAVALAPGF
jgi:hypothetical protein